MSAAAETTLIKTNKKPTQGLSKPISWETFQQRYLSREDGYTYEWVNGQVEKTKRSIDYKQLFIAENLIRFFNHLVSLGKVQGFLTTEVDTFFFGNHRRPDICYFTKQQIRDAKLNIPPVPNFVAEVISNNDKMKKAQEKLLDYWNADVKVIWHIFPDLEMVHVYHGRSMNVYLKGELVSAAPVLPDFTLLVDDIFI